MDIRLPERVPEEVLIFSEIATIVMGAWLVLEALRLTLYFVRGRSKTTVLLRNEFLSDTLQAAVTLSMGLALLLKDKFFVEFLVVARPWVLLLNIYALRKLRHHYKRMR